MDGSKDSMDMQQKHNALNSCYQQMNDLRVRLSELDSALSEISEERKIYKIIGNIMVSSEYSNVKNQLDSQRKTIVDRLNLLEGKKKQLEKDLNKSD